MQDKCTFNEVAQFDVSSEYGLFRPINLWENVSFIELLKKIKSEK